MAVLAGPVNLLYCPTMPYSKQPTRKLCKSKVFCSSKTKGPTDNSQTPIILRASVGLLTEILRLSSLGKTPENNNTSFLEPGSTQSSSVYVGDIKDVINILKSDYKRSYFLTGDLTESIYKEDCYFVDPTIKFKGRDLYQRNLQLLVPFFVDPSLVLHSIKQDSKVGKKCIEAEWEMRTYLKLPWKPLISLKGYTTYDLDDNLKIENHVERWNISAFEAIKQLLAPSSSFQQQ